MRVSSLVWMVCMASSVSCAMYSEPEVARTAQIAQAVGQNSVLFGDLWGFGDETTGGADGVLYTVLYHDGTSGDPDEATRPGTLRYGIETLTGARWIVFDETAFPAGQKKKITLKSPLRFQPGIADGNVTIDGRGSYVSLRRDISTENPSDPADCHGGIIQIVNSENIILTHLDFERTYPAGWSSSDKEKCGDIVAAFNPANGVQCPLGQYDRIWINQSDFRDCGDECIGMTRYGCDPGRANVTISRNQFVGVGSPDEKGILFGLDDNSDATDTDYEIPNYGIAVSVYRNRFYNIGKRLPRMTHGYVRAYNNAFEVWESYGILASDYSRVIIEQNVFRGSSSAAKDDAWKYFDCGGQLWCTVESAYIWARDNKWWTYSGTSACPSPPGGPGTGSCDTTSFPACSPTGPWYYDCSEQMVAPATWTSWSYATALEFIRGQAGWKNAVNDVRP